VRVKVCGLTRREDVLAAVAAGVDAIGLNFYPPSPRSIAPEMAEELLRDLPPFIDVVAVCVDPDAALLSRLRTIRRLRCLQWHGTPPLPREVEWPLIPAFRVRDAESLSAIRAYLDRCGGLMPEAILVDAHVAGLHGGTGQVAPWGLLAEIDFGVPLILAGGLTPANVAEATRVVRPYSVDTASGVEVSPGVKDAEAMRQFVAVAR